MSVEVTVCRPAAVWRDRLRGYKILVDGDVVTSIKPGETQTVAVAPGQHRIWARIDWCRSPILDIDAVDGARLSFTVRPNGYLVLVLLYVSILRTRYLNLSQTHRSGSDGAGDS